LAVAIGAAFPGSTSADVIISSGGTLSGSTPAADGTPGNNGTYIAAGFTINTGSTYTFSDAIAYGIQNQGAPVSGGSTYSFGSLWLDNSGSPGTLVQNLTTASNSGQTYEFTPTSAITLSGGDTYWIVLTATNKQFKWLSSLSTPTGPGATYDQAGQGILSGSESSPSVASYSAGPGGIAGFEIDGTPAGTSTPEPSSLALLGSVAGVATLAGWWKRRRQSNAVLLT